MPEQRDITLYGARSNNYPADIQGDAYSNYPSIPAISWAQGVEVEFQAIGFKTNADFNNWKLPHPKLSKYYRVADVEAFESANAAVFAAIVTTARTACALDNTWQLTHFRFNSGIREMFCRFTKGDRVKTETFFEEDYQSIIDDPENLVFAYQVATLIWTYILTNDQAYWANSSAIE